MTPFEILQEYKAAKNPRKQLAILADENETTVPEIRRILIEQGVAKAELHTPVRAPRQKDAEPSENALTLDGILDTLRGYHDALIAEKLQLELRVAEIDKILHSFPDSVQEIWKT